MLRPHAGHPSGEVTSPSSNASRLGKDIQRNRGGHLLLTTSRALGRVNRPYLHCFLESLRNVQAGSTRHSTSTPVCRFTSATPTVLGSENQMRTRAVCSLSTCPRGQISRFTVRVIWNELRRVSTTDRARHLDIRHHWRSSLSLLR